MGLRERILAGRGVQPPELVLKRGRVVNVFTNEVHPADVAIQDGHVVGLGEYSGPNELDLGGAYVLPGLIDGHLHIESTMLAPGEFARAVVPRGVTGVVVDPHEIANVLGVEGIRLLLAASAELPLDIWVNVSSCVPASSMETSGHVLEARDMAPLLGLDHVVGIAEVMNFPGVLNADPGVLAKLELGLATGVPIDGHAPGVRGRDLCGYLAAGIESDHETTGAEEAEEKLRLGMWLMVRQGSTEHNLAELLPVVRRFRARRAMLVTDDRTPTDLRDEGHLDHALRLAIAEGIDPVWAVAMATINPAERFGLKRLGAVGPGYLADLMVVPDLQDCRAELVLKRGRVVARDGAALFDAPPFDYTPARDRVHIAPLDRASFRLPATGGRCRAIGLVPGQIVTEHLVVEPTVWNGEIVADPDRDLVKYAVIERHRATGNVGVGLVKGFGVRGGALASSVAHDAHNIGVLGTNDEDMLRAVRAVVEQQGGLAVVADGQVLAELPLPLAGLMSDLPFEEVARRSEAVDRAAAGLGCAVRHPFMVMSFLALSVIPSLKLTDQGLVDVDAWRLVPLKA
ncbi:MAG: adenine deaminase [Chloroflexi bacterium]|nr:adenine deaminase [Chloroflexota bacterium]